MMTACILWTGYLNEFGYGRSSGHGGRSAFVHRQAWERQHGPIPAGLVIDHLCRVRNCINTEHMEVVTVRENTLRGQTLAAANAAKTMCSQGHPFSRENTYVWRRKRKCRTCHRARVLRARRSTVEVTIT